MARGRIRARILLLCDDRRDHANTVLDHIAAFVQLSRHDVKTFNPVGLRRSIALDLDDFDIVVLHYSLILSSDRYVAPAFREQLRRYTGVKIQFMQDEYRWVDRAAAAARDAGIDVLFTCAPAVPAAQLYDERLPGVRRVETLTGYVPDDLAARAVRPHGDRPLDVAYRGRDLPYWLGRLTQEKTWIAQGFAARAAARGLRTDIAWREQDRIYGERWTDFISSARATLGTESGASIADFSGSVEASVKRYLRGHPSAPYEEVHEAVLRPYEGNVTVNVISPRVFEAAALGTALIMFPGTYSGIVHPGEHYIVLNKDFSNFDDVIAQLEDRTSLALMAGRTRADLVESGRFSYRSFIAEFDALVDQEAPWRRSARFGRGVALARLERGLKLPPPHVRVMRGIARGITLATGNRVRPRTDIPIREWIGKGGFAVRIMASDPELRQMYRVGRGLRIPRRRLLKDIIDLYLMRTPGKSFDVHPAVDLTSPGVRLVSVPRGADDIAPASASALREALSSKVVASIEWDHSAISDSVDAARASPRIAVGPDGVKRLSALEEIARRNPEVAIRVLAPLIPDGDVRAPASSAVSR